VYTENGESYPLRRMATAQQDDRRHNKTAGAQQATNNVIESFHAADRRHVEVEHLNLPSFIRH